MLTGNLCLLTVLFGIMYFFVDIGFGRNEYLYAYGILIAGSVTGLILLRKGHYTAGRLIYLSSNLIIISGFAMIEPTNEGIYLFFIVLAVASLTVFGHQRLGLGIGSAVLILILFLLLYFGKVSLLPPAPLSEEYYRYAFGINFLISLVLITIMIHYLIRVNYVTLSNIQHKEQDLMQLTTQLSESRNRFKLALHGSSAGIWDWDARRDTLYISPMLNKITGYPLEKTIDANLDRVMNIVHPDDRERVNNELRSHLKDRAIFKTEFRLLHGDGHYIWVLDSGQAEWDEKGEAIRMVGSVIDITERKNSEKMIREQNAMLEKTNTELDRFVYSVSHDLKSPLSSILGLMSIAELSKDRDEIMRCLTMMRERVDTLNGFIEEIIDYSRNTRTDAIFKKTDIPAMIQKVIDGLNYMENMEQIRMDIRMTPGAMMVTDPGRLKIILNNLIGNAVKYHNTRRDDPFICVGLEENSDHHILYVKDNGQGIPPDLQKRVFEMFYRGHESSKGSGLGLYIAREMARKLEGDITLVSEKNEGSTFMVRLPKKSLA